MTTVIFENELTTIGKLAFAGCTSLNTIELPETVTSIGDRAFAGCTDLQKVVIPARETEISDTAFANSNNVTLYCLYDSSAYSYAKQKNIPYVLTDNVMLGDANGNDVVGVDDVSAVQRYLAELESLEGIYLHAADTNQDGEVDISDATNLQAYLAEYPVQNPIGEIMTQ